MTLLETIRLTSPRGKELVSRAEDITKKISDAFGDRVFEFSSIVLSGNGSSKNSATISTEFIEKAAGLPVYTIDPNNPTRRIVPDPKALYIFISESGSSSLIEKDVVSAKNCNAAVLLETANPNAPLGKYADCVIETGCNDEQYFFHTVGMCCSVIALMLIGMSVGLLRKAITKEQYDTYKAMAVAALDNHPSMVDKTVAWCEKYIGRLVDARCIVMYGSGPLFGVAEEGTVKIQEITERNITRAYQTFRRFYGSTTCYGKDDVIIALDDGVNETVIGKGIVDFMDEKYGNSYMIGPNVQRERDLQVNIVGGEFRMLEFLAIVEVIAYELALAENHPVLDKDHYDADFFDNYLKGKK